MKKYHLLIVFLFTWGVSFAQHPTNLVPIEDWVEGTGSVGPFIAAGDPSENTRETMVGPHGYEVLGWNCENTVLANSSAGGFYYDFPVDTDKTYRYAIWMRKKDILAGYSYLWGANNTTLKLDGSAGGANVFWYGALPEEEEWYLIVGYVHRSSYTGTESFGGVFNQRGEKILSGTDFKWLPATTTGRFYSFTYSVPANASQDIFAPRVDVINGNEPSIGSLVGLSTQKTGNLLHVEDWTIGTGSVSVFNMSGLESENSRVHGLNPHGESSILWKATTSGDGGTDGGWETEVAIDNNKSYRFSVWMKKGNTEGNSYFGAWSGAAGQTLQLDGTPNGNAYFWVGQFPEINKWYLLVGYVHGSDYTGMTNIGGIYDGETGEKIASTTDYKSTPTATRQKQRVFLHSISTAGVTQEYWGPRLEPIDGNEPTIMSLLGTPDQPEISGNLLPIEEWQVGTGSIAGFYVNGSAGENAREFGVDPHGQSSVLWTCTASGNSGADGGWITDFPIDHTKTYRLTTWVKKNVSNDGNTYLGAMNGSETLYLDGTPNSNPYFWYGDLPELDKWYLMVGYIHGSSFTGMESIGGIYDGETGEKVIELEDFKNATTTTMQRHRAYLFYCSTAGVSQNFWGPRAEMVDGNEPTIQALLGVNNGPHVWSEITEGAVYNEGSIGIGVDENDMDSAYKLLVDGDIKTRKVKVTLDGWADHVFDDDYELLPLPEVERFIQQNKHLPGIPTEQEVLKEGLYLGENNAQLLQKIEELTLYVIELEKKVKALEQNDKGVEAKN